MTARVLEARLDGFNATGDLVPNYVELGDHHFDTGSIYETKEAVFHFPSPEGDGYYGWRFVLFNRAVLWNREVLNRQPDAWEIQQITRVSGSRGSSGQNPFGRDQLGRMKIAAGEFTLPVLPTETIAGVVAVVPPEASPGLTQYQLKVISGPAIAAANAAGGITRSFEFADFHGYRVAQTLAASYRNQRNGAAEFDRLATKYSAAAADSTK